MKIYRAAFIFLYLVLVVLSSTGNSSAEPNHFDSLSAAFKKELDDLAPLSSTDNSEKTCPDTYSKLYSDNIMTVSIFLGVLDTPDGICLDRAAKQALIDYLLEDCQTDRFTCGFAKVGAEPTLLRKRIENRTIMIRIYDSSISEDGGRNMSELAAEQMAKSEYVADSFLESLKQDKVVFYIGHTRYGTGPGFYHLPFMSSQWISNYISSPLMSAIAKTLSRSTSFPQILGLFSCSSQRFYARPIHDIAPRTALIVSDGITEYRSDLLAAASYLNLVIGNCCSHQFNLYFDSSKLHKFSFFGFFENSPFPQFKKNNNIVIIAILLLLLPGITFVACYYFRKLFSMEEIVFLKERPFELGYYLRNLMLLLLSCAVSLIAIKLLSQYNNLIFKQSIPLFFILMSLLLYSLLVVSKKFEQKDIVRIFKFFTPMPVIVGLLYFAISLWPFHQTRQIPFAVLDQLCFIGLCTIFLPCVIVNQAIIGYPLFTKSNYTRHIHIVLYLLVAELYCIIIGSSLIALGQYLYPYKNIIIISLFCIQISYIFFIRSKYKLLPIAFQTIIFSLIISENIHGLFF